MRAARILLGLVVVFSLTTTSQANLLVNGDFEAGNTGFTSGYTFVPNNVTNSAEGIYSVGANPTLVNAAFVTPSGISGAPVSNSPLPGGQMLFVNGSSTPTTVYSQTVSGLTVNTTYLFSGYLASLDNLGPAVLTITAGSTTLFSGLIAPLTAGTFSGFQTSFNSGASTSLTFSIVDTNTAASGNDFALDSLALNASAVPEPTSFALMGAGVLGLGVVAGRIRRKATA